MVRHDQLRTAVGRLMSALAFGGSVAAGAILIGVRDLESYVHAFFSLDRGTAARAVEVLGHPVYTLALGLGVRLPLHGSLGASPAAAVAPYLPAPLTYWCLLAFSISAAVMVVRHALEPICGRLLSWLAMVLLFYSVPMVNYTIYDDWPETAVTYCAIVACVFAPHAFLAVRELQLSDHARRVASLSLAGLMWGLIGVAHPGYWPLLAASLVCSSILALCRTPYPLRTRVGAVAALAAVSLMAVGLQVPDIAREIAVAGTAAGEMSRFVQDPKGGLISANVFPFGQVGARMPFTFLALAVISLLAGLTSSDARARRLTVGGAIISMAFGISAVLLSPGSASYAPSNTWALRDPAMAFAVLSGACAAALVTGPRARRFVGAGLALAVLVLAGLQGPLYAARLILTGGAHVIADDAWTRSLTPSGERVAMRGLARDRVPPGGRLAFWPGVTDRMRNRHGASTDFADAGYPLVTAWTKNRTMRGVVEPNDLLFDQSVVLAAQVLCDANAVRFLQLRYLLMPRDAECPPWTRLPGLLVDGWLDVGIATQPDQMIRAVPAAGVSERMDHEPALSAGSVLLSRLVPLPETSLTIGPRSVVLRLNDPSMAAGQVLVLPVAYDSALRASTGQVRSIGGLVGLVGVNQPRVTLDFVPDVVAVLRAVAMTVAQVLATVGFLGLVYARPRVADHPRFVALDRLFLQIRIGTARGVTMAVTTPALRTPRNWYYLAYIAAVVQRLDWRPEDSDETSLLTALLLPVVALVIARLTRSDLRHRSIGATLLAFAILRVSIGGSLAAEALHDPLFWAVAAAVACGASMATGRWPLAALTASAVAGASAMVATLLPGFAAVGATFPPVDIGLIRQSFGALTSQLGVVATVLLLILWIDAIAIGGIRGRSKGRTGAAARGALLAALALVLAGAMPGVPIEAVWVVSLGILVGLAEAGSSRETDTPPV